MNDKQLTAFIAVAEEGSINNAASKLFLSPSGLFKQVNSLEEEIDEVLFRRGKKGIELTAAGKVFYEGAKEQIAHWDNLLNQTRVVARKDKKSIIVGSWSIPCYSVLPKITNYFRIRYPEVELVFRNITGIPAMQSALKRHEIDVTFSFGGISEATRHLRFVPLAYEKPQVLVPMSATTFFVPVTKLKDFCDGTLVTTDSDLSGWHQYLNSYIRERYPTIRLYAIKENEPGILAMQNLAAPAIGAGSTFPKEGMFISNLELDEDFRERAISIDLVCRLDKEPMVEQFIECAQEAAKIIWVDSQYG